MDDSAQLQSSILNPPQEAITVPSYRRRPIRSRTYQALLQILSLCPVPPAQGDLGNVENRSGDDEIGVISHSEVNRKESEDRELAQETFIDKSKEDIGDGSFLNKQTNVLGLGRGDDTVSKENGYNQLNTVEVQDIEKQSDDNDAQIAINAEKMKCGDPVPADDVNAFDGHLMVDEEFSINDFSDVLGSGYMDMAEEPANAGGDFQKNGAMLDEYMAKETKHEHWMNELEFDKLMSNPGAVKLSSGPTANNEVEEGEISSEAEDLADPLSDTFPEKRSNEEMHNSGAHHVKEDITDDEKRVPEKQDIFNSSSKGKSKMMVEMRTIPDYNFIYGFEDSHTSTQMARPLAPSVASGRILLNNAAENQISLTTGEDDNPNKKKRKKGPMTQERKAKKKKKERLKRAEKNRQLGVNKLRLPTVLKPKKITYCRHYLQGRCHEGEKCKFSHDTVPLSKSKPCGYFARNSCMKGDDCPFDHELSKYPCNNYATTGYCGRGSSCLFSHEMPSTKSQSVTPNISKSELKSEQQMFHKNVPPMASKLTKMHSDNNPCKGTERPVLKNAQTTASQPPKGINLLKNEQTPVSSGSKQKQDSSSAMAPNAVNGSHKESSKADIRSDTLNENKSESTAPRKPRGINFLTFAQPFSDDSSNKMPSNLVPSSSNESTKGEKENGNSSVPNMSSEACTMITPLADLSKETNRVLSTLKPSFSPNTPTSVRDAVQSTLAFAEKFDASIKIGSVPRHRG